MAPVTSIITTLATAAPHEHIATVAAGALGTVVMGGSTSPPTTDCLEDETEVDAVILASTSSERDGDCGGACDGDGTKQAADAEASTIRSDESLLARERMSTNEEETSGASFVAVHAAVESQQKGEDELWGSATTEALAEAPSTQHEHAQEQEQEQPEPARDTSGDQPHVEVESPRELQLKADIGDLYTQHAALLSELEEEETLTKTKKEETKKTNSESQTLWPYIDGVKEENVRVARRFATEVADLAHAEKTFLEEIGPIKRRAQRLEARKDSVIAEADERAAKRLGTPLRNTMRQLRRKKASLQSKLDATTRGSGQVAETEQKLEARQDIEADVHQSSESPVDPQPVAFEVPSAVTTDLAQSTDA